MDSWNSKQFFHLGIILAFLLPLGIGSEYMEHSDMKVCIGTNSRLSVPSNREHHYRNLRERFINCTYVDGNLELTWLQDKNLKLNFLEHIREVTGYILISHVDVEHIVLPKLQIIRGRTFFKLNVQEENFSLFVTHSQMHTLELPALRDILQGSVGLYNNFNLCHIKTIEWEEIMSDPEGKYKYVYNFTVPERECPKCDKQCERGCWGEGPHNCQKFSKLTCSPQCAQGRCFGPNPRECCHLFCAGGCTGPTQKDCLACRNFYDDGVCKQECPPMQRYNPITYLWEANPEGKYAYGATCVKSCPEHLLRDNGACVRTCPSKKMAKDGECVPCNGPCPKTCPIHSILHSGNIDDFKGCTIIDGSIRILDQTFAGYQEVYRNFSFGPRYVKMHPDRLEVFSTVKEVTGFIDIQGEHPDFKNLSYFRNLEVIHGRQLMENYFASFSVVKSSLVSLELKSLKRINSGAVVIQENPNICYADGIDWSKIQKSSEHGYVIAKNRDPKECRKDNFICSEQCDSSGCWGAGPDQCLECKNYKYNGTCIASCDSIVNAYHADSKTCKTCHRECKSCIGPGPDNCTQCRHVRDGHICLAKCPETKYSDNGICRPCSDVCNGCTGPRNTIAHDGCITCEKAIINDDASIGRCLGKNESCPIGYYFEYFMSQEQTNALKALAGKILCRKCHPRCKVCKGYGFHESVCLKCAGYKRGEQCEDECPMNYYADEEKQECFECHKECQGCYGPGPDNCISCRTYKLFLDGENHPDNTTAFNCTDKCPPNYPHVNTVPYSDRPYCAAEMEGLVQGATAKSSMILIGMLALLLGLLVVMVALIYHCRQKTRAKKEAVKMSKQIVGCEDAEPLRPTNIAPNLNKLRIIKESELSKSNILGTGAFGKVFKGVWVPEGENVKIPVAIKELLNESGFESSKEFLAEAYIMASVEHPNLVKLLAVCMASQMMLVTQLMPLGSLFNYVREKKNNIGSKALLNWSAQIARGMAYLEERRLVHRDLAARNVLVQTPSFVKITDFGLAKLLAETNEYKAAGGKMPIKWLALECIRHRIFTSKSDVWAFGVTIWELLTFGQRPHENVPAKDIPDLIESGAKLEQPEICSLDVYCTLLQCWHLEPEMRPSFKQLVDTFADYARDPGRYLVIPGDKFTRLPPYTSQDEKDLIRRLSSPFYNQEPQAENEDYLQPKVQPGPSCQQQSESLPKSLRYCSVSLNRTSSGDDETDSNYRKVGIGNLHLDLPLDEDDYLMPTCQPTNGNSAPSGYMDLIGVPASIDNPEYLMSSGPGPSDTDSAVPTQTIGIPVLSSEGEQTSSDHEYYNDLQRELQPLHRSETTV
ncbi:epidermal growth factor receptor isoform X2 [Hermetia illucens]|uniref:epidermal growth factor receptor isoform X2 n=1 Tax=Hermetia illucens TaxID=343691 RepID=UPI0018CBF7E8|nr:epidermal growth factor receptor isoform X2 [Hermetia illucens]